MILSEQDSGRTVEMGVGEVVSLRLKENPITGFRWSVDASSGLESVSDHYETVGAIGGEGIRVLQFRTKCIGSYGLRLKNWREWQGEASVIARYGIKIVVR